MRTLSIANVSKDVVVNIPSAESPSAEVDPVSYCLSQVLAIMASAHSSKVSNVCRFCASASSLVFKNSSGLKNGLVSFVLSYYSRSFSYKLNQFYSSVHPEMVDSAGFKHGQVGEHM